tara:strand:+ start:216 stop:557 length:342 start_codon:yes stop_codon:yes gene_type:complete
LSKPESNLFLIDIINSINEIRLYTKGSTKEEFMNNPMMKRAVERCLEIIGESARNLPIKLKQKYSQIPWQRMTDFRNLAAHKYWELDYDIIWEIVTRDLGPLEEVIKAAIEQH